ncbi:MAG: hypothetical protein U0900_07785 [Myxococcota bacterium]
MSRKSGILSIAAAIAVSMTASIASAQGIVVDFNALSAGSVVTSVSGVGFTYVPFDSDQSGFPLIVSSGFASSSGARYLGVQDGRTEFFQAGDAVNLSFPSAVDRVAVTFVVPGTAPDGAFGLRTGATTVTSTSANRVVLPTGDSAYTLHLLSASPFSTASAFSSSTTAPRHSLDDVVVPEPGVAPLLAAGIAGLVGLAQTARARRVPKT